MDKVNERKLLCSECYQKHCICLVLVSESINSDGIEGEDSLNLNGFDEIDSIKINSYKSDANKKNDYNGVFQFNGGFGSDLKLNGDCGVDVKVYGEAYKLIGDHSLDGDSEDDEPITFYSKLITPPASLLLKYIRAEKMNEGNLGPIVKNLMKRLEMIHNLNVDDWLKLLEDIDDENSLSDSISVSSLDDDNASAIVKPIQPPSKETANVDRPKKLSANILDEGEAPTMNGLFTHNDVNLIPSTSTGMVPTSSNRNGITKYYSLFG